MYAQVSEKDLQELEERVEKKMEKSQAETKNYVSQSDTLNNRFIDMISVLWGVAGLLLGGLIAMIYQAAKQRFMLKQESKYAQFADQMNRLTETEKNTMFVKDSAFILVIHKESNYDKYAPLVTLQKLIFSEYQYRDFVLFEKLGDWKKTKNFQRVINSSNDLLVIVMNDDLLDDLKKRGKDGNPTREFTDEGKAILQPFFDVLIDKQIGFFNVGRSDVKDFYPEIGNHSIGFANEPYSAYSNINNLLKYMMYAKNIKPTQKRKF